MQIYWTLQSVPELQALSPNERKQVWRLGYPRSLREVKVLVSLAACGFAIWIGGQAGDRFGVGLIGAMAGGALGAFVFSQVVVRAARRHLRTILAQQGGRKG